MKEKHPSYGMIQIHRTQGGTSHLFGSSIEHRHTIRLTITRGEMVREYNHTRYWDCGPEIVEVEMSPTQFAEAITHLNCGNGTPCTIMHVGGERMAQCPFVSQRKVFVNDFKDEMLNISNSLVSEQERLSSLLEKKSLSKGDRAEILKLFQRFRSKIDDHLPFIHQMYNEAMDKTATEAKGEVEAFIMANALNGTGLIKDRPVEIPALECGDKSD